MKFLAEFSKMGHLLPKVSNLDFILYFFSYEWITFFPLKIDDVFVIKVTYYFNSGFDWKKSRTILQRPLRTNVLDNYIQIMNEEAISVVKNLQMMENTAESFNVLENYIAPATFKIVCSMFTKARPVLATCYLVCVIYSHE